MQIHESAPQPQNGILPGADFADAWKVTGISLGLDAQTIAGRIGTYTPGWVRALLGLRNALVAPLGLKTGKSITRPRFPVLSSNPNRVVLGLDDKHLDFRLVVEVVATSGSNAAAVATTYVRTHNWLGRLYLAVVTPFHRIIVPAVLRRAVETV